MMRFVADGDLVSGHTHIDVHIVEVAGLVPPVQLLDRYAATDQMFVKPVELADALANVALQRGRGRHVLKDDLERCIHRASSPGQYRRIAAAGPVGGSWVRSTSVTLPPWRTSRPTRWVGRYIGMAGLLSKANNSSRSWRRNMAGPRMKQPLLSQPSSRADCSGIVPGESAAVCGRGGRYVCPPLVNISASLPCPAVRP